MVSAPWQSQAVQALQPAESIRAVLVTNLDDHLHASQAVLLLTGQRLLTLQPDGQGKLHAAHDHALQPGMSLVLHDHAGVAMLELVQGGVRLAVWRFTLAVNLHAQRLVTQFGQVLAQLSAPGGPQAASRHTGSMRTSRTMLPTLPRPRWSNPRPPGRCCACGGLPNPYQWQLLAGFLLMLASTAATLVPPYLTMPLMDDILIPFQTGKPIEQSTVLMYLGGLLGAALVAWSLGWAKTYILALVSERTSEPTCAPKPTST